MRFVTSNSSFRRRALACRASLCAVNNAEISSSRLRSSNTSYRLGRSTLSPFLPGDDRDDDDEAHEQEPLEELRHAVVTGVSGRSSDTLALHQAPSGSFPLHWYEPSSCWFTKLQVDGPWGPLGQRICSASPFRVVVQRTSAGCSTGGSLLARLAGG